MASKRDQEILNCIFNPLQPMGESFFNDSPADDLEAELYERKLTILDEVESENIKEAKKLEIEGVKAAENGKTAEAIDIFSKAIQVAPTRPSGYNNRAQAYRLLEKDSEAMLDLNNAINLSQGKGHAARQAFCQRGMLLRKEGKDPEAKTDFEKAANLGSDFAKAQVVEMNPYAALCNMMLHDVFTKLQRGDVE
ncbi:hypothetical protein J437_LFUL013564 [Ladona fulva]|uniref:Tetratricopeptide repeat protein 36 n=1 Tax=Ladona fulva TaxID=123851 RepID=A0A8K0KGU6_LADFU|nr:hypothetical protein J437_LFUL013564 [Ladona fulva]